MNILHVISDLDLELGGVTRAVLDLANETAHAGHSVTVACWNARDIPDSWRADDASPRLVEIQPPTGLGKLTPEATADMLRHVRSADVVHLHTPWEPANRAIGRICEAANTPYVLTLHGMLDDWSMSQSSFKKRLYLRLGGARLLRRATFIHCTAQAELDQSVRWYPRSLARVVPLIFDVAPYLDTPGPELAREAFGIDPDVPTALFLSRIHIKKGVHILVKAAAHMRDAGVECQTLIAGTGDETYERAIRAQIEALKLGDRVRLLGMVRGDTKLSLYRAADVFALPTSQENFGFVLPEALACGIPAITTRGVDIWPELLASGSTVIAEQTHLAFAEAIAELLVDAPRREEMGAKGRAWVLDHLDPSVVRQQYESLYREAAGQA